MDPDNPACSLLQHQLFQQYRAARGSQAHLPTMREAGFKVYSQSDEDGLLLFAFAMIGMRNKICVDIGFSSINNANTSNLILNWGFTGLLTDGNKEGLTNCAQFFATHPATKIHPPKLVCAWITAENINDLLRHHGFAGEIDLLSLDIDGVDYWIWKNLDAVQPRVVILEYQDIWGPDKAVAVRYDPAFDRHRVHPDYHGASLRAFVKLGKQKGYRLVGCNIYGYNAVFVRAGLGEEVLPEISPEECFVHPKTKEGQQTRLPAVRHLDWVEV